MKRRVVVTGMGVVSPIGTGLAKFWSSIREGRIGFAPIEYFDASDFKAKVAAQVKDFVAGDFMDPKAARRMELFCQFAVAASKEAMEDAGLDMSKEDPFRVGVSIGSGVGSLQTVEREHAKLLAKGPGKVGPMMVPLMIGNMAAGNVSIQLGLRGKNINVCTACATGTNSIGEAMRSIQYGEAEVMLAGGAEASITPISMAGFSALTALSTVEDPKACSLPFDKNRSGFVMGEGAGVLVLEERERAIARGAKIYGEVAGYGATADAYHITSPAEDGSGAAKAMEYAIADGGISKEQVDYINAHGTATPLNDLFETRAIKLLFGDHAYKLKVNSTKSMVGHLLGAAGAVEAIAALKSLEEGYIHATVGYQTPDEELDLDYCKEAVEMPIRYALSNSLGFGGHNASLLFAKAD